MPVPSLDNMFDNVPPMPAAGPLIEIRTLPNGCSLYRQANGAGGHTYVSDEVGGGVVVWDTCLVDISTLTAAIDAEFAHMYAEKMREQRAKRAARDPEYQI